MNRPQHTHAIRRPRIASTLAATLIAGTALPAQAALTRIEILERQPFAGGRAFGEAGPYERIIGRFHGELDPAHPLNRRIVDLGLASRNDRGRVEYTADLEILKPVDATRGNGTLLYDVNNRGNKVAVRMFNDTVPDNTLATANAAGDGFLFRNGFTLVWSGWIPDSMLGPAPLLRFYPPVVEGLTQPVWDEFLFNDAKQARARLTFRATGFDRDPARRGATLTVRSRNDDSPSVVHPRAWEFVDDRTIRLLPAGTPFAIGQMYQLTYTAIDAPVAGAALAATRDLVAHLREGKADRAGTPNPLAGIRTTLAHGTSQSGRFLRDFVYQGFNESEDGKRVFDGMNPHIASQRIFLNHRFAQPNRLYSGGYSFFGFPETTFPYAYGTQKDPLTGRDDGLLARCTARGNCPRIVHTVTSTEYWQGGQSLGTTDVSGRRDAVIPDNVRVYHLTGTQHVHVPTMGKGICNGPTNSVVDPRPILRGVLLALDRWVKDGTTPPASRYPTIADGTLVPAASLRFPNGLVAPREPNPMHRFDYGPRYAQGIIDRVPPVALPTRPAVLVPAVDADGNETAGVRMPNQAVPLATTTGWALRTSEAGAAGELCYLDGLALPFAKTADDRAMSRDARPSATERYGSLDQYAARVKAAAEALGQERYLAPEDVGQAAERARQMKW